MKGETKFNCWSSSLPLGPCRVLVLQGELQAQYGSGMLCRHSSPGLCYCPACALTPASGLMWCLEKLLGSSQPRSRAPFPCPGITSYLWGNHPFCHYDSFFFPKPLCVPNLWHSAGSLPWAMTTLHILTGCKPPSPAHLSPSKESHPPLCLVLCDSCFVPSMPFPSPLSEVFVQSNQHFSFTVLSIAQHPGTQTAPVFHLSSLLACHSL